MAYIHDGLASETGGDRVPFERGREWVSISVSPNGSRPLSARREMGDSQVERQVVFAVDSAWRWDLLCTTYVLEELRGDPRIGRRAPS